MARKLRDEDTGAIDDVMNRGDRHEPVFHDEADRQRFVETIGETCAPNGLAGARLFPHAESFSSGGQDAPVASGRGHEVVSGHLHQRLQTAEKVAQRVAIIKN